MGLLGAAKRRKNAKALAPVWRVLAAIGLMSAVSACATGYTENYTPTPVPGLNDALPATAESPKPPEVLSEDGLEDATSEIVAEAADATDVASVTVAAYRPRPRPANLKAAQPRKEAAPTPLVIKSVVGAPGDGDQALAAAMREHMLRVGAPLADKRDGDAYILDGLVVNLRREDLDEVTIIWRLWAGDSYLGEVVQSAKVPKGALEGPWGEQAVMAAGSARNGLLAMIAAHSKAKRRASQSKQS
ncbi:MAG: hypothetical protein AAGC62_14640 [Pseudomonadota bacterium]